MVGTTLGPGYGAFTWFPAAELKLLVTAPSQAHAMAAAEAAGIGARLIRSSYTGRLARDISRITPLGPLASEAGSELPYAAIENWGGTITAKNGGYLYIRGQSGRSRGSKITATATSVQHQGKHYLEAISAAYPALFIQHLDKLLP
jgi:hypothetical protein